MVDSGSVELQSQHFRVVTTGEYQSASEIGELAVVSSDGKLNTSSDELIRIKDIATVREAYIDPPTELMRVDGLPAIALAMAPAEGVNLVEVGARIDRRLAELEATTGTPLAMARSGALQSPSSALGSTNRSAMACQHSGRAWDP